MNFDINLTLAELWFNGLEHLAFYPREHISSFSL